MKAHLCPRCHKPHGPEAIIGVSAEYCETCSNEMKVMTVREEPKGLFATHTKVGTIFPVFKNKEGKYHLNPTPCHNDCRGENVAMEIMEMDDFVTWAIDPWTSIVNLTWDDKV